MEKRVRVHPTADVSPRANIGDGTSIWHEAQVREGVSLGEKCIVGKGAYIDFDVQIGSNVKIQNRASLYHGVTIEDGVFIGPHVCLTNDKLPRAVNADGSLKGADDWQVSPILIRSGAALGAATVVLPGVTIGRWAMVGSGSVVTRDVPDYGLVWGNPARLHGYVCPCGRRLEAVREEADVVQARCPGCGEEVSFVSKDWEVVQP
ncbi:MAG: N-acetyltransferase [Anaerolineae bacterium]|nr:N-acetyltransferase [Anaerolineae bacterium]